MNIGQWWPKLSESSQVWLLQNLETELPAEVRAEINAAGGDVGSVLSEADNAWLDEVNNGGSPA